VAGPPHKQQKKGIRLAATAEICATLSSVILGLPSPTKKQKRSPFCPDMSNTLWHFTKVLPFVSQTKVVPWAEKGWHWVGLGWIGGRDGWQGR